jgi:hypothetical protein
LTLFFSEKIKKKKIKRSKMDRWIKSAKEKVEAQSEIKLLGDQPIENKMKNFSI